MKRLSIIAVLAMMLMPLAHASAVTILPGMLIKASGPAIYYYTNKNTRLVFPNEKTYFSWFNNFNTVTVIPDVQLSSITISGNVTYRPGKYLVKITTDPKVYAVDTDGSLRWVQTEAVAKALYGNNWAKMVQDIPDAFFVDYATGPAIVSTADFNPNGVTAARTTIIQGVSTPANDASY